MSATTSYHRFVLAQAYDTRLCFAVYDKLHTQGMTVTGQGFRLYRPVSKITVVIRINPCSQQTSPAAQIATNFAKIQLKNKRTIKLKFNKQQHNGF